MKRGYAKRSGIIMSPDEKLVKFNCITDFALNNGLSPTHITQLLNGQRHTYKGWQIPPEKPFKLKYYDGTIHEFKSIIKFSKENNLNPNTLAGVLSGKKPHHRFWVLPSNPIVEPPKKQETRHYFIKSPQGKIHHLTNICAFCREHHLERSGINKLVLGTLDKINEWTRA